MAKKYAIKSQKTLISINYIYKQLIFKYLLIELKLINENEVIFFSAEYENELKEFVNRNYIKKSERVDIWALINEPFLDTEFDDEDQKRTIEILIANGLTRDEIHKIRNRIKKSMVRFNVIHWERGI